MKKILTVVVFGLIVLAQANLGYGAGFLIYEHGAAAMAMAGAFVSIANDPSAIWHNPAGIAFLKGTQVSVGTTLIWSRASLELTNPFAMMISPKTTWNQISQTFYPSNFYLTRSLTDKVTVGFGFFSPFGLGAKWPPENPLRYLGYEDDMKTFFFNPVLGIKLSERFSLGLGFSYIYSTVTFKLTERADFSSFGFDAYDVPAVLKGNGKGFNFNAGLLYRGDNISFGLNYRSRFNIKYTGDLKLDSSAVPAFLKGYVANRASGETTFRFPDILGLGVSFNLTKKFLLSADAHYVIWSRFDNYEIEFSGQDQGPPLDSMVVDEAFKDSWTLRLGLQYMVSPKFALRAGYLWDETPQPEKTMDPLLPDANRSAITAGLGYTFGKMTLDVTYHHEAFNDRTAPNRYIYQLGSVNLGEGLYKTTADLLGISLSFVF